VTGDRQLRLRLPLPPATTMSGLLQHPLVNKLLAALRQTSASAREFCDLRIVERADPLLLRLSKDHPVL
jgi:hypothetical protein